MRIRLLGRLIAMWRKRRADKVMRSAYSRRKARKSAFNPRWVKEARKYIGLKEVPGKRHNPAILRWWKAIKTPWFISDEVPWCAGFCGGILEEVGIISSRSARARSFEKWGEKLSKPVYGCIAVFWRGSRSGTQGHVAFVVGKDRQGRLMCLGGNQGDAVSIKPFSTDRVLSYRWPNGEPHLIDLYMPIISSNGQPLSTNEA